VSLVVEDIGVPMSHSNIQEFEDEDLVDKEDFK
jgi:hypothetical protein